MKKVFLNSLPKSGTNLVAKCLKLLGYEEKAHLGSGTVLSGHWRARLKRLSWRSYRQGYLVGLDTPVEVSRSKVDRMLTQVRPNMFVTAHVGYTIDLLRKVENMDFVPLLITRDPRAVLSSFVHYVVTSKEHVFYETFKSMSKEERFVAALRGKSSLDERAFLQPLLVNCVSLDPWLRSESVLSIKFEDLIGSKGGGTDERQREILEIICNRLDVPLERIENVTKNLFGPGLRAFRKGQIDSWRDEIPAPIIKDVEHELKDILDTWGYR
jgi:hypothetical protein